MDLSEFLLARIAEDEEVAREAAGINGGFEGGDKVWCPDWLHTGIRHLVRNCDVECPTHEDGLLSACGWPHRYAGAHIARHDPARVLAECEAKRRIVEAHPLTCDVVPVHTGPQPDVGCETCHTVTAGSVMDPDYVEALGPCETLLALALPYADHDEYRDEWKP